MIVVQFISRVPNGRPPISSSEEGGSRRLFHMGSYCRSKNKLRCKRGEQLMWYAAVRCAHWILAFSDFAFPIDWLPDLGGFVRSAAVKCGRALVTRAK